MNDTYTSPSVLVVSTTTRDADLLFRSEAMIRKQSVHGAMTVSCHWGSPRILVAGSLELAASATQLLHAAGLTQPEDRPEQNFLHHHLNTLESGHQPPVIHVSLPAGFGVELMLLAGAALRPLADRRVLFAGLCGSIDSSLRKLFDTAGIDALTRFANQLPKHRIDGLYPLFFLIGALRGVARGVLDHVVDDRTIRRTRAPHRAVRDERTHVTNQLSHAPIM